MMKSLINLAFIVGAFAIASVILWGMGWLYRKNIFAKALSWVVVGLFIIVLAAAYFIRFDIGSITVSVDSGSIKGVTGATLLIDEKLDKYNKNGKTLYVFDKNGNMYYGSIPLNVTTISYEVDLYPGKAFMLSFSYLVAKFGKWFLIVTWGKIFALFMSSLAVFIVWAAGYEGRLAFLVPSGDD